MSQKNEYAVRVSIFGRMFEEPSDEEYGGLMTLERAWVAKIRWEEEHEGYDPVAEVIHVPTGRTVQKPLVQSSYLLQEIPIEWGLSVLRG